MPREAHEPPNEDLIRELSEHNLTYWGEQRAIDAECKDLALDRHAVSVPDTKAPGRAVRVEPERMGAAEGARIVKTLVGLYSQPAPVALQWVGEGQRGAKERDKNVTALQECWDQLNPPADKPYLRERAQMFILGRLARLQLSGHEYWWDLPERAKGQTEVQRQAQLKEWGHKAPLPILWRDLPAEATFPASLSRVEDEAMSEIETTWWELAGIFSREELGDAMPERKEWHQSCTLYIYANREYIAWAVGYRPESGRARDSGGRFVSELVKMLRTSEHKLGRCPIRILAGATGPWKEPGIYWQSVLFPVRRILPQIDRRLSEAATANRLQALPMLKAWLSDPNDEGAARIAKVLQGDIAFLDKGSGPDDRDDIQILYQPPVGSTSLDLANLGLQLCRQLTGAVEALQGVFGPADMPAWTRNYAVQVALNYLSPWTQAVVEADKDAYEMIIRSIEVFGEPLDLVRHADKGGTITLAPENLTHWEPLIVTEYKPKAPRDTRADLEVTINALTTVIREKLPIAPDWLLEQYLEIEKPEEMLERSWTWRFLTSQKMEDWYMQNLLQEADVEMQQAESLPLEEFMRQFGGQIPPEMLATVQQAAATAGSNGANPMPQNPAVSQTRPPYSRNPMSVER